MPEGPSRPPARNVERDIVKEAGRIARRGRLFAAAAGVLIAAGAPSILAQQGGLGGQVVAPAAAHNRSASSGAPLKTPPAAPAPVPPAPVPAFSGEAAGPSPGVSPAPAGASGEAEGLGDTLRTLTGGDPSKLSVPLRILGLLTVLTLVPSIILLTTCFPRIVIVLSFVRRAIGTSELPPNQIIIGLSLFLTAMIMGPIWEEIHRTAIVPYQAKEIGEEEAVGRALLPLKKFMIERTLRSDLRLMVELARYEEEAERKGTSAMEEELVDLPIRIVIPAFVLSELKMAFQMGFVLYLPFVVIDLIISTALISMGMLVLPPILISLPLKVLVFVLVDGWRLIVQELVRSFI